MQRDMDQMVRQKKRVGVVSFGTVSRVAGNIFEPLYHGLAQAIDEGVLHKVYWSAGKGAEIKVHPPHPNIEVVDWIPQFALLSHKATALFVTHAGTESCHEGMLAGVPMLAIPVVGDQAGNSIRMHELGIAKAIDKRNLTHEKVLSYAKDLVHDREQCIHKNVRNIKEIARRSSTKGLYDAVDTLETIAHVGDSYLFSDDRHVHWIKQHNYDIFICSYAIIMAVLIIIRVTVSIVFYIARITHLSEDKFKRD
jgi:glucuronosyltransferase